MKNEEIDWIIYHLIADAEDGYTHDDLEEKTGMDPSEITASVSRLKSVLLITCRNEKYRAFSIEEFIITSQIKQDPLLGLDMENGVIKARK